MGVLGANDSSVKLIVGDISSVTWCRLADSPGASLPASLLCPMPATVNRRGTGMRLNSTSGGATATLW
jgi:hypothetical protein